MLLLFFPYLNAKHLTDKVSFETLIFRGKNNKFETLLDSTSTLLGLIQTIDTLLLLSMKLI